MATVPVRRFAVSVDPDEVVDFATPLSEFETRFKELGFEQLGTYRWRYADRECTVTVDLRSSTDGFELWATVQAPDEHEYRIQQMADAFDAFVIAGAGTGRHQTGSKAF